MTQAYYTYRIRIANKNTVQIEQYDAENNDRGQPSGQFGYKGKAKTRIQKLHQAVRDSGVSGPEIQELGEKLFEILLDPGLRNDFFAFYREAQEKKALLRIELDVDERQLPEIVALPWEFMRVSPAMRYSFFWLSTHPDLIFSRRRSQWQPPKPIQLAKGERLRIALAVAAPNTLRPVKYELIWEKLQAWAREQQDRVELLGMVNPATRLSLDEMLEREPHILHFIGHGRVKDEIQRDVRQIALVETVLNDADWLDAEQFIDLFNRHQPGVVFLQTCEGATSSDTDAFVGVASHVVQQNIPVVVAMQYEISNATAQSFALEFYERLADNEPVDKAAQEGRRRISLGPLDHEARDFATPVLFMRVRDGRLFISPNVTAEATKKRIDALRQDRPASAKLSEDAPKRMDDLHQPLSPPTNMRSSVEEKIRGYKLSLEKIRSMLAYDQDLQKIGEYTIDSFKRTLRDAIRGIEELSHDKDTIHLVESVDAINAYLTRAIDSLSMASETLDKTNTMRGRRVFYQELRECQRWLSEAIRYFNI